MLVEESAISADVLAEEDIRSLPSSLGLQKPDQALHHPNSHKGQWFGIWGEVDKQFRPIDLGPGIWFGTHDVHGRLSGQYRPDRPRTAYNGHTVKYESCRGTRPSFAVPVRCREALVSSKCEVIFVEGYKKALTVASAGGCAISLAGVDAWSVKTEPDAPSEPIDDFDAVTWHGRTVWIGYDSDIREKDGVQYAEKRLTKELEGRGAIVISLRIPHRPDGSKRGIDDYIADRLADGVSREDALAELKTCALAELVRQSKLRRQPAAGTDGEQACQTCPELREQIREYRMADELVKRGPFTPDGAQIVKHLVTVANAARRNGKEKLALEREDVARLALGETGDTAKKAVSRALKAYSAYQNDPEVKATLPYRLEWREGGRKTHIDLYPLTPETPRSTADEYQALSRLPRDRKPPAKVVDRDDSCRRCHSPEGVEARGTRRCLNDACGHTWHTRPVILGRTVAATVEETPSSLPILVGALPGQNVPASTSTYGGQNVPANDAPPSNLIPFSSVTREDMELAAGPHYHGEAPPEEAPEPPAWQPPPIAPSSHIAPAYRRYRPPETAAASGGAS